MSWIEVGWQVFEAEAAVEAWLAAAGPAAIAASRDAALRAAWLRHGATWFVGVDVLPNGPDGAVAGGRPLGGAALAVAEAVTGRLPLHPGQVSVTYPGYPARDPDESDAAHRFRKDRDAAHLDGLLPVGPDKRRFLREPHGYILGFAVTEADAGAAPLVVWEGSHRLIRDAFETAFREIAPGAWADRDVTEVYAAARRAAFATCTRRELPLRPGQAVLIHRHAIHGVAPWASGAQAAREGRVNVYFRPLLTRSEEWLDLP